MTNRTRLIPFHRARPVGGRVKIILEPPERLSDIIEVVDVNADKEAATKEWGIIVEMGDDAFGPNSPNPDSKVKVGDLAVFNKYAGRGRADPNNKNVYYRTMNDIEVDEIVNKEILEEVGYDSSYAKKGIAEVKLAIDFQRDQEKANG